MEYPYWMWECYKNGMYDNIGDVNNAVYLLSDCELFDVELSKTIINWPLSSQTHLSNKLINRQAWCGQAACSFTYGVSEQITRKAWKLLTGMERYKANKVADKHIKNYERKDKRIRINMAEKGIHGRIAGRSSSEIESIKKSAFIQGCLFGNTK